MIKVGIDAIHYHVPKLMLPIASLAEARGIEYAKLNKGLGLEAMSVCDAQEDVATMAAEAAYKLIKEQGLAPQEIDRIYLGTESALDAAKPTAAYILGILEAKLEPEFGARCLRNCDVVDLTFACIGGVDALLNSADYIRLRPQSKALVIAADKAQYDLASTGEYTQGAGAVAMLMTANPRILKLDMDFGVATKSEHDFFKPRRNFTKTEVLRETAKLLGQELKDEDLENLWQSSHYPFWHSGGNNLELFREEPVFDGPYSNDCYKARTSEALDHLSRKQAELDVLEDWSYLVFHLPYAFQARRMFVDMWFARLSADARQSLASELEISASELNAPSGDTMKRIAKSNLYRQFIAEAIAPGEKASSLIGNMYTASIFMSFLSLLEGLRLNESSAQGKNIGFIAYGSGSKSKVFSGSIQEHWQQGMPAANVFETLAQRQEISFKEYVDLHQGRLKKNLAPSEGLTLEGISTELNQEGYRIYS